MASGLISASTPPLINYQGRILDSEGNPVPDGNYAVTFTIYDAPTDGTVWWTETQPDIAVTDGYFGAVLGNLAPISDTTFKDPERYLEIAINGQAISPRVQFTSTGYAYQVGTIDGATGGEVSGSLKLLPTDFSIEGNAVAVTDATGTTVFEVSVDEAGFSNITLYTPTGAKRGPDATLTTSLNIGVSSSGSGSIDFYDPVDSKSGSAVPIKSMSISVDDFGVGSIAFYEPADSKNFGALAGPRVEMNRDGLIMYGATQSDTSLYVAPNGDIVGLGQITMGQNSSDGFHTSVLGFDNNAAGDSSSIGGGSFNQTFGTISVIGGGFSNTTTSTGATIGGGANNNASGEYATIAGGLDNSAAGAYAMIPGGQNNNADGYYSFAAGHRAKVMHNGTFVWADQTDEDFVSSGDDQFLIRASGGVGIGTDSPTGLLDVVGEPGDGSVNLPNDAVSSGEILDEPGLASDRGPNNVVLPQGVTAVQDVVVTTITIPAAGYIMVSGGATLESVGTNKANQVFIQIDETSGGGLVSPYYTAAGAGDHDTPSTAHFFAMSTQRIYYKEAGVYEFRLEGMTNPDNGSGAISTLVNPYVTAVYFPTAYGNVSMPSGNAR